MILSAVDKITVALTTDAFNTHLLPTSFSTINKVSYVSTDKTIYTPFFTDYMLSANLFSVPGTYDGEISIYYDYVIADQFSLTGSQLQGALNVLVGDIVSCEDSLIWFNDAINELTSDLSIEEKVQIATVAGRLNYYIPPDCLSIVSLPMTFSTWADEITFDYDPGDSVLDLYYYRKPIMLKYISDTPVDIPVSAQYALVLYAAMRYKQADEEMAEAEIYRSEFEKKKDLMVDVVHSKVMPSSPRMVW